MNNMNIYTIEQKDADKVAGFISRDAYEALKNGLPVIVLAAAENGEVKGVLTGALENGAFALESLFVEPGSRREGTGRALMNRLDHILSDEDMIIRAEYNIEDKDNETLAPFLEELGFEQEDSDYPVYYMSFVRDFTVNDTKRAEDTNILPFSKAGKELLRKASAVSLREGYPLPEGGLLSVRVDRDASFCLVKDGRIAAYLTVEQEDKELIRISSLFYPSYDPKGAHVLLLNVANAVKTKYSPLTRIAVPALSEASEGLIRRIFPGAVPVTMKYIRL